jgi:hypothetical protein
MRGAVKHNQIRVNYTINANPANYRLPCDAANVRVHPLYFGEETVCMLIVIAIQILNLSLMLVNQRVHTLDLLTTSLGG